MFHLIGFFLAGCSGDALTSVSGGEVPATCAALADKVDGARVAADVATLAVSPRASDARRAEVRAWIAAELAQAGVPATEQPFEIAGQTGVNLQAGAGPVLVAAHYDSVEATPGADDNATGVAVTLAVARALGPKVRYVFFDVEEPRPATVGADARNFAFGSQAWADDHGEGVDVALIVESVGFTCDGCQRGPAGVPESAAPRDGRGVYLVGNQDGADTWATVAAAFTRVLPAPYAAHAFIVPGNGRPVPQSRFSDNAPLWDRGIDAVMLTDTALLRNPHYHKGSDTPETLDAAFLAGVARGTVVAAATLAGACGG